MAMVITRGGGVPTSIGSSSTPFSHKKSAVLSIAISDAAGGWCGGLREKGKANK